MGKFQRFDIPEELTYICGRPCILHRQVNAEYLVLLLTSESGMGSANEIFSLARERTDADFVFAAVELTNAECVPLKTVTTKTQRFGRDCYYSTYSPDTALCGVFAEDGKDRLFPSTGSCLPMGMESEHEAYSPEKCGGAERFLEYLENRFIPEIREKACLDDDVRIVLGGHGTAGLFAVWAGHMTDTFHAVTAISPAPLPAWWHEFSKEYSPLAEMISVSYGENELSAFENNSHSKFGAYPVIEFTYQKYDNERFVNQMSHEGGHNDKVALSMAEDLAMSMGGYSGFFFNGDRLKSFTPRSGVTGVVIPEGVVAVCNHAFKNCTELEEVTIPEGVRVLGEECFYGCTKLRKIVFPKSLNAIGAYAFTGTRWLKEQRGNFVIVGGVLMEYRGSSSEVVVPEGVNFIQTPAFTDKKGIVSITLPKSFFMWENEAFNGCDDLREIKIPSPAPRLKLDEVAGRFRQIERLIFGGTEYIIKDRKAYTAEELRRRQEAAKRAEELQKRREEQEKLRDEEYRQKRRKESERQRSWEKAVRRSSPPDSRQKLRLDSFVRSICTQKAEYERSMQNIKLGFDDPEKKIKKDESTLLFTVSVKREKLSARETAELLESFALFEPTRFEPNKNHSGELLDKEAFFDFVTKQLEREKPYHEFTVHGRKNGYSHELKLRVFADTGIAVISCMTENADTIMLTRAGQLISSFAQEHDIISAALRTYAEKRYSEPTSPRIVKLYHPVLERVNVPTKFPGAVFQMDGVFIGCCYEMWYGSDYGDYISMEKLLSFENCRCKEVFGNGTVHIIMYDSPNAYADENSAEAVVKFREHTGFEKAVSLWEKYLRQQRFDTGLENYEIMQGSFLHGGETLVKVYLDEYCVPEMKWRAVKAYICELDRYGEVLDRRTLSMDKALTFGAPLPEEDCAPDMDEVLAWVSRKLPPQPCRRFGIKRRSTTRFSSKLGGLPYFPKNMELPADSSGEPMRLMVQINFSELSQPWLPDFPEKGILQIFISNTHDMFGMNEDDLTQQKDFRVIYHEDILDESQLMSADDLPEYEDSFGDFPFEGEYKLIPHAPEVMQPTFSDFRMEEVFVESYNKFAGVDMFISEALELDGDDYNAIQERNGEPGAFMGGYPYFVQEDPRTYIEDLQDCDTVLFELGSIYDEENDIDIMFGDMGTAVFLISKEDLKALDFSHVAYNYDCG